MMGGFSRFLLGGALGAVLGILFIKKQSLVKPVQAPETPPAVPAAVPVVTAPEPAVPAAVPVVEAVPVVTPVAAPVVEAAPAAVAAPAPVAAAVPVWIEPVAPPAVEPAVEPVAAPVVDVAPVAPPPPVAPTVPVWTEPVMPAEPTPAEVAAPEPAPVAAAVPVWTEPVAPPAAAVPEAVAPPEPVIVPEAVAVPEPVADESHAAAWVVTGVAAAEPAHAVAEPEAPEAEPEILAAAVYVAAAEDLMEQAPVGVAPSPAAEDDVEAAISAAVETSGSEVVLTPQVLEEPLPGSGWETSAVFVEEEMELEELLPVMADDVRPYEGPEVPLREPALDDQWTPGAAEAVVLPAAEPVEPPVEEITVAEVATAAEDVAPAPIEAEEPAAELVAPEAELAAPAAEVTVPAAEAETPTADEALGEDLKSRIEETRRRIREELERPFAVVDQDEGSATGGDIGVAAVSGYAAAQSAVPEPPAAPSPVIGEPMYVDVGATETAAAREAVGGSAPNGNGSDYDAMRARIELTRSRLKAKAFDAMMAGESSLLRRDPEGTTAPRKSVTVDNEIEQTVESTLREEDD